jgi:hypothetical protein
MLLDGHLLAYDGAPQRHPLGRDQPLRNKPRAKLNLHALEDNGPFEEAWSRFSCPSNADGSTAKKTQRTAVYLDFQIYLRSSKQIIPKD